MLSAEEIWRKSGYAAFPRQREFHESAAKYRLFGGAAGMGLLGLNELLSPRLFAAESRGVVNPLHHPAKAKRVIFLYQAGGPSHLETFDYKPKLQAMDGQGMPESFTKGQQIAQLQGKELKCFGPQYGFKTFGKSQQQICELFPHIGSVADDVCIIRSMMGEQINHDPAHTLMNTGSIIAGRPSMGSWITYGLGSENRDLPAFVVMMSRGRMFLRTQFMTTSPQRKATSSLRISTWGTEAVPIGERPMSSITVAMVLAVN